MSSLNGAAAPAYAGTRPYLERRLEEAGAIALVELELDLMAMPPADRQAKLKALAPIIGKAFPRDFERKPIFEAFARDHGVPAAELESLSQGTVVKHKPGHQNIAGLDIVAAEDIEIDISEPGIVDGLLDYASFSMIYGSSNVGKTFFTVDLACRIGAGLPWQGHHVERCAVLYVASETPESVKRRIYAWQCHHELAEAPWVYVVSTPINLYTSGDAAKQIVTAAKEIERQTGRRIQFVIFDTLAASMVGGDENTQKDINVVLGHARVLVSELGAHVSIVHHAGKDASRGARGGSGWKGAVDQEIEIEEGLAKVTKQRDGAKRDYGFQLVTFHLGVNRVGRAVTTCVAVETEVQDAEERPELKSPNQKAAYDGLKKLSEETPPVMEAGGDFPFGSRPVHENDWLAACAERMGDTSIKRRNEKFKRAVEALREKELVDTKNGYYWLVSGRSRRRRQPMDATTAFPDWTPAEVAALEEITSEAVGT